MAMDLTNAIQLDAWADRMAGMSRSKREQREAEARNKRLLVPARLPAWPEDMRGVPNDVLRSALFSVARHGETREYHKELRLAATGELNILLIGELFDQADLDVWEAVLHIARKWFLGEECTFTAYSILKLLGKSDTGPNRKRLEERLRRLKINVVEFRQNGTIYMGSLVDAFSRDAARRYVLKLNPDLCALFERGQWTAVDWEVRKALIGHPLAQWLHGFYSTHAKPFPIYVETLHKLCGTEIKEVWKFRQNLAAALEAVAKACAARGQCFEWKFVSGRDGTQVIVNREPTSSQKRYLEKQGKNLPCQK